MKADIRAIQAAVGAKVDGLFGPNTARATVEKLVELGAIEKPKLPAIDDSGLDSRTATNVNTLTEGAQKIAIPFILKAKAIAASMGVDLKVISGNRTYAEQNALYAKGRTTSGSVVTNAKGGYSNHNFGIAWDFGCFQGSSYLDGGTSTQQALSSRVYKAIGQLVDDYKVEWGGNWRTFKDYPHFEVSTGLTMAQKRSRVASGQAVV